MAVAAYNRNGKVWGHDFNTADTATKAAAADTMRTLADGTIVVNTTSLAKDISGFGGPVPLEIYIRDGKVSKVVALKNSEAARFLQPCIVAAHPVERQEHRRGREDEGRRGQRGDILLARHHR